MTELFELLQGETEFVYVNLNSHRCDNVMKINFNYLKSTQLKHGSL